MQRVTLHLGAERRDGRRVLPRRLRGRTTAAWRQRHRSHDGRRIVAVEHRVVGQLAYARIDPPSNLLADATDVGGARAEDRHEAHGALVGHLKHAVGDEGMEVQIAIERGSPALHKRHRAAARIADAHGAGDAALPGEDAPDKTAEHQGDELRVAQQQQAHGHRKGHHPLAVRCDGQHALDQVRSGVIHPSRIT